MIITQEHPKAYNYIVFDITTKKEIRYVISFDTDTREVFRYSHYVDKTGRERVEIKDREPVVIKEILPNCVLINCETEEIIK